MHDMLLVLTEEELAKQSAVQGETHHALKFAFAEWLNSNFPRLEVPDIGADLRKKGKQVAYTYPEIWSAHQASQLRPKIDGETALALLRQCGFTGAFRDRRAIPAIDATASVHFLWNIPLEGAEVVTLALPMLLVCLMSRIGGNSPAPLVCRHATARRYGAQLTARNSGLIEIVFVSSNQGSSAQRLVRTRPLWALNRHLRPELLDRI
ncbi:MAG: hypothetical protein JXR13_06755 [Thalassovita sp.]